MQLDLQVGWLEVCFGNGCADNRGSIRKQTLIDYDTTSPIMSQLRSFLWYARRCSSVRSHRSSNRGDLKTACLHHASICCHALNAAA